MYPKNILFLIAFFCLIGNLSAQKGKDFEVIEFGEEGKNQGVDSSIPKFIIKTSPTSFVSGNQFIELEKYVNSFFSVQAGVGLTFKPLIAQSWNSILGELDEDFSNNCDSDLWASDVCDNYSDLSIRKTKPGFLISGSARLFFDDDVMDGSYFALKLRYSTQNLNVQDVIQNASSLERIDTQFASESVKKFDIVGHYGHQVLYSKLVTEYFVGLGARLSNETRQDIGRNAAGLIQSDLRSFKQSKIRLEIGLRIGFQL